MASKKKISKRLKSAKEGKATWQDEARWKTWNAYKLGSQKTQGYQRAKRNIQRAEQMGRKPNEVDLRIIKSHVPQTRDQMKAERLKAGIGALTLVGGPAVGKGIGLAAKAVAKKMAGSGAKKAAAKKAVPKAASKAKVAPKTAAKVAPKTAAKVGPKAAGNRAANKVAREEAKKQTLSKEGAKRAAERAKRKRRVRRQAAAYWTGAGITAAGLASLRGDTPKKPAAAAAAKPKPGARATENAVAEKKRRATAAAAKKKRLAEERRHAEEFIGTGPRGAVDPKHILQDEPPKSKRGYDFFKGGLQKVTLPKLLGGREVEVDSRKEAFGYMDDPELNLKRGGRLKKKTKPRKRPALRGGTDGNKLVASLYD